MSYLAKQMYVRPDGKIEAPNSVSEEIIRLNLERPAHLQIPFVHFFEPPSYGVENPVVISNNVAHKVYKRSGGISFGASPYSIMQTIRKQMPEDSE